jgi:hypothetical protein
MPNIRQCADDPMRDLPTTTEAVLAEIAAHMRHDARGLTAPKVAEYTGLDESDTDVALAELHTAGLIRPRHDTMGYVLTAVAERQDIEQRAAGRVAA